MWSDRTYTYLVTGMTGLSTISNLKCFDYIKKTFDSKGNIFRILAQDSLVIAIGNGLFFATNLIDLIDPGEFV